MWAEVGQNFSRSCMCILRANSVLNKKSLKINFHPTDMWHTSKCCIFHAGTEIELANPLGLLPSQKFASKGWKWPSAHLSILLRNTVSRRRRRAVAFGRKSQSDSKMQKRVREREREREREEVRGRGEARREGKGEKGEMEEEKGWT